MTDQITVRGARLHNLKNVTVSIPKNQLVVLTGISGSGKSTFGFDILLKEGQRQYLESLGLITYGFAKPPVEAITGLSPSISVDQRLTNHSPRSTVGTVTGVYTYLRVLYARLGHRPCPRCGHDAPPSIDPATAEWEDDESTGRAGAEGGETFPCPHCGVAIPELDMANFSFNKPEGACPTCTGLGMLQQADISRLVDETKSLSEAGAITGRDMRYNELYRGYLRAAGVHYGFEFDFALPIKEYDPIQRDLLFYGAESPQFRRHFPAIEPPATVRQGRFEGIATGFLRRYAEHVQDADARERLDEFLVFSTCPDCGGARIRPESRAVTIMGKNIVELTQLSLIELGDWVEHLPTRLGPDELQVAEPILADLNARIGRLIEAGAGYLAIDRSSPTLSAGEAQRLRLAALLGSGLSGVLYVFDEPTIGLHQRDTQRLIGLLRRLRDLGNTVLVIEHDLETIGAADHVIDFGPGAGKAGGQIVATGAPAEVAASTRSVTGAYLAGRSKIVVPQQRRAPSDRAVHIRGARENNLQNITVRVPLGVLVAVTGVSGSGKSSLIFDILDRNVRRELNGANEPPGACDEIEGLENIERIITIDQEQLGRMPRSNAATYSDTFTPIREVFAGLPEARERGFTARHFSFNVPGGRCERCEGAGVLSVNMQFLPAVEVRCPACHGRRFHRDTLAVHYRGYDIAQVLQMTVAEALDLFETVPAVQNRLKVLNDVGLGYLPLGQPATTLSGGEAQRVKLAKELGRRGGGHTLYLLDEPTTGLHVADTARLLDVLHRLVAAGNSVIVVEHNLELVKVADWVIDLGPEGGTAGGRLVAEGTPESIAGVAGSYTGRYLSALLTRKGGQFER